MKRLSLAVITFLLAALGTRAQSGFTTVTATVLDPTGVPYAGCHGNASFVPSPSATTFPTIGGSTFPTTAVIAACDSFGNFTLVLADNNQVVDGHTSPPASQWQFNIVAREGNPSFICTMTITGTTQNITSQIQACAAPLPTPKANSFASVTVQQSATPTFTGNGNTGFIFLLNQNVTSSTFTTNAAAGTSPVYQINICQDSVGGHTMVWPSNVTLPPNYLFNVGANTCSPVSFIYNPNTQTWSPWQVIAPIGASLPFSTIPFSTTPSFLGTPGGSSYGMTLTNNVTSSTVTGFPVNGNIMKLHICQGAGAPWTFAFPANFLNTTAIQNSGCTDETYSFDGTNWSQLTQPAGGGGGGGGACSAAGSQGTVQAAGTAGACQTTNLSEVSSTLTIKDDQITQGANPYLDIRAYGAVAVATNSAPFIAGITATCNGTTSVTLSSASSFVNGQGVAVQQCGATNTMSTPSAPTVASSLAAAPPGTGYVVNGATGGAETTCYKIVARDKGQGITAASAETCVTGQTRGTTTTSITSCVRSANTLVTCTTSAPHTLTPGAWVKNSFGATSDNAEYGGYFVLTSVPDNTHYAFQYGRDSRAGASTTASGTGTATYWQCNHLILPTPGAGVWQYAIYRGASGAETFADVSMITTTGVSLDSSYMTWDDFGTTYTTVPTGVPAIWPSSAPGSATNDTLVTTISSGAGSTTLTLANSASQSIGGVTILTDNEPNYVAALTAAATNHGMVYVPQVASGSFGTNTILDLTSFNATSLSLSNAAYFGDTLVANAPTVRGDFPSSFLTTTSFSIEGLANVTFSAKPGVYTRGGVWRGIAFNPVGTNTQAVFVGPGSIPTGLFEHDAFLGASAGGDFASVPLTLFTQGQAGASAAGIVFSNILTKGNAQGITPLIIDKNFGELTFNGVMMAGRGTFFGVCPTCTIGGATFNQLFENQGPAMPLFVTRGTIGLIVSVIEDTGSQPIVAHLGPGPLQLNLGGSSVPSSGIPQVTGTNIQLITGIDWQNSDAQQGVNVNYSGPITGLTYDGFYGSTQAVQAQNTQFLLGPDYSLYTNPGPFAAPTCNVATAGPPFSFSAFGAGTYTLAYTPIFANGGQGLPSATVSCTVDGATQQATITISPAIFGAIGYRLLWGVGGNLGNYFLPTYTTTSILVPNASGNTQGQSQPRIPGGGPAGLVNGLMWSNTFLLGQYIDVLETAAPSNPGTGHEFVYADSTTHRLNCLTSTGANCLFPYAINSYSGNHQILTTEQGLVATATLTFTAPHAAAGRSWDVFSISGTTTLAIDSGTLYGNGSTGSFVIPNSSGVRVSCDGTNCYAYGLSGGAGGGSPGGSTNAIQYNGGGGSFGGVNSPITNGNYIVNYNVTASASVPPTITLPGVPVNAQTGTTYTIGAANTQNDRATLITATNGSAQTYTMVNPSTTGFGFNMPYSIWNRGTAAVTENASGFTVNGGASLLIPPNWVAPHWSDGINWFSARYPDFAAFPNCVDSAGQHLNFTSSTGALSCGTTASGTGLSGMTAGQVPIAASATTVTSSEALAGAGAAITTGPASSTTLDVVEFTGSGGQIADAGFLASNVWRKDAANVSGAVNHDFSAGTWKWPAGAGATAGATSNSILDTTNKNLHCYMNNADAICLGIAAAPTTGDLADYSVSSGNVLAHDSGILTANVVTAASAATAAKQTCVSSGASKTCSYIDFPDSKSVPFAICVNGTAATGVTTTTAVGGTCRAGTNNKDAFIGPFTTSDSVTFKVHLPKDWDTGTAPSLSVDLASTDATAGHTIILQAATECSKLDGTTTDDVAFNTAQAMGTITLVATANQAWTTTLSALTTTGCSAPGIMWVKITRTTDTATNVELYEADVTIPRLLTNQAN